MSTKEITTPAEEATTIADANEIEHIIPVEIETNEWAQPKMEKYYDPNDIDSVVDMVTNADPIGSFDVDQSTNPEEVDQPIIPPVEKTVKKQNPKKIARKNMAKNLFTLICITSMFASLVLFGNLLEGYHLEDDIYDIATTIAVVVDVIFHMMAYGFIIGEID